MAAKLGQPIVIENQAGAGGAIGARQVASAAPDGYTLMIVSAAHTFGTQPILTKLDYDPFKTFVPVGMTVVDRQVMVMNPSLPMKTLADVVQHAKANPGKLNNGAAVGIGPHFIMELFKIKAGVNIVHVPYRGSAPIITDLIAGQIQLTMSGKSVLLPHIEAGKMRAIAVTSAKRWSELPDVPTLVEAGYLDFPYDTMSGIVTRTGTPPAVIAKLNAAINDGLAMPDVRLGFAKLGIDPNPGTPEEFSAIIARDAPRWAEIVRVTGITAAQ